MGETIERYPREMKPTEGKATAPLNENKKAVSPSLREQAADETQKVTPLGGLAPSAVPQNGQELPKEPEQILRARKKIAISDTLNELEQQLQEIETPKDIEQESTESNDDGKDKDTEPDKDTSKENLTTKEITNKAREESKRNNGSSVENTTGNDNAGTDRGDKGTGGNEIKASQTDTENKTGQDAVGSVKDDAPSGALKHGETHASRAIGALSKEELEALPKGSIGQVERITNTLINPQSLDEKLPTPNEINKALMHRIDQVQMQAISKANALLMDEEKLRDLSPTQLIDFVTKLADLKLVLHWTSKLEKVILGDAGKLTAPGQGKATPLLSKLKSLSKSAQKELTQSRKAATGGSKKAPGWMALPPARSG